MSIVALILKIIILILGGMQTLEAVMQVAEESGESFERLWSNLPEKYK